ncbi:GntR family transcriptional regulator [Hoyosella sp. G463]|uniref:GntR family transcriptional regulator n=1 Tax=Lolliginicoccus lacisalsi TaxID=2742202 RepID=A0A927PLL8_9ACTN|nr:GntR family transcriptional regulator [Lolliginicoccus lacisalsi]MBD8507275.1 GntR family transcriptional regulator [Lolliginicoccus lacisalsi]
MSYPKPAGTRTDPAGTRTDPAGGPPEHSRPAPVTARGSAAASSASDRAYESVKERIITGALAGGELISEGDVARELGVSRTPVREGFLRLEAEGWMRLYPKRGALVVPIAPGEAESVVEARFLVEVQAVRRLASEPRARAEVVQRLERVVQQMRDHARSGDVAAFSAGDAMFHGTIVEALGNPLLEGFYRTLRDRQRRMSHQSVVSREQAAEDILADHGALVEAIRRGDGEQYADRVCQHMRSVHRLPSRSRPDRGGQAGNSANASTPSAPRSEEAGS